MREPLKDRIRLGHIEEAANNIARFTAGKTYDDMLADDMMSSILPIYLFSRIILYKSSFLINPGKCCY